MVLALSRQVVLSCIWKPDEQAIGNKPASSDPWTLLQFQPPGCYTEFLLWLPSLVDCDLGAVRGNKPFLFQVFVFVLVMMFMTSREKQSRMINQKLPSPDRCYEISHRPWTLVSLGEHNCPFPISGVDRNPSTPFSGSSDSPDLPSLIKDCLTIPSSSMVNKEGMGLLMTLPSQCHPVYKWLALEEWPRVEWKQEIEEKKNYK